MRFRIILVALLVLVGCGSTERDSTLPEGMRPAVEDALRHYEAIRAELAGDGTDRVPAAAGDLAAALEGLGGDFAKTADAARGLASVAGIEEARTRFGVLSRSLIRAVSRHPELTETYYLFECPMVEEGINRWIQPTDAVDNPFMGSSMPRCGSQMAWEKAPPFDRSSEVQTGSDPGDVAYYTCSMDPSVKASEPGTCPICGMDLTPVTREELETGMLLIDAGRRRLIGMRTEPVTVRSVRKNIQAQGTIMVDETRITDVTLKVGGYVEQVMADEPGQRVRRGDPLFTVYSQDLYAAQQEYLTALESSRDYLKDAARRRLELWDLDDAQIDALARSREAQRALTVYAPATGYILEKGIVEGSALKPGDRLYRIGNLDRVWLEVKVYESDLPFVERGQELEVRLPHLEERIRGMVSLIDPVLDPRSRTGRVRIDLDNPGGRLQPGMFADIDLAMSLDEKLVVPEEAVILTGNRHVVFVDMGDDRYRPTEIQVGARTDRGFVVNGGLREGDVVVTSGNFLLAAESRLKSSLAVWP